jgi:hypothetical protein
VRIAEALLQSASPSCAHEPPTTGFEQAASETIAAAASPAWANGRIAQ